MRRAHSIRVSLLSITSLFAAGLHATGAAEAGSRLTGDVVPLLFSQAAKKIGKIDLTAPSGGDQKRSNEPAPESIAMTEESTEENQKLGLVLGFLDAGEWEHAKVLLKRLAQLDPATHQAIGDRLRADLKAIMRQSKGNGGVEGTMPPMAFELIEALGVQIYKVRQGNCCLSCCGLARSVGSSALLHAPRS
jgi:hypothetical protein